MLPGIDFSFGNGLTTAQITKAGFHFVGRYLSGGSPKDETVAELQNYLDAGIPVISFWETTGTDMTSKTKGEEDAGAAQAELEQLANMLIRQDLAMSPVFFAADAPTEADETGYLQGCNAVIGKARTALYGGFNSIKRAFDNGLIEFGCQTYAWSGGQWDDRALLRQVHNGVKVGPADCDIDQAAFWNSAKVLTAADNFGQWPIPQPVVSPAKPARRHIAGPLETWAMIAHQHGMTVEHLARVSAEYYTAEDFQLLGQHAHGRVPYYTPEP